MEPTLYPVVSLITGYTPRGGGVWKYILHAHPQGLLHRNISVLSQVLHFLDFSVPPSALENWRAQSLYTHYNGSLNTEYTVKYEGDIFLDSGGFTLMFDPELDLGAYGIPKKRQAESILELQIALGGKLVTSLDYPIPPGLDKKEAQRRQEKTLNSAIKSASIIASIEPENRPKLFVPIHGLTPEDLTQFVNRLRRSLQAEGLEKVVYGFALGSMVPRRKGGHFEEVLEFARAARKSIPEGSPLHVFGVTGGMIPYLMAEGVSSFDASGYIQNARVLKFINPKDGSKLHWKHLDHYPCNCIICQKRKIPLDRAIMAGDVKERQKSEVYAAIALHNLEIDLGILAGAKQAQEATALSDYIEELPHRYPKMRWPKLERERIQTLIRENPIRQHSRNDYDLRRRKWEPNPQCRVALILPCSQEKPYTKSQSFRAVDKYLEKSLEPSEYRRIEMVFLSGLYGPVPEAHVHDEPILTYDYLLHHMDAAGIAAVSKRLLDFIVRYNNQYTQVIAYITQPAYRKVVSLAIAEQTNTILLPKEGRMGRFSFYKQENLAYLSAELKNHLRRRRRA